MARASVTQRQLEESWWSEARQAWVITEGRDEVAVIPGTNLPGSEHPSYYTPGELADDIVFLDGAD